MKRIYLNEDTIELGAVSVDTKGVVGPISDTEGAERLPFGLTED